MLGERFLRRQIIKNIVGIILMTISGVLSISIIARTLNKHEFGHLMVTMLVYSLLTALDGIRPVVVNYMHSEKTNMGGYLYAVSFIGSLVGGVGVLIYCILISEEFTHLEYVFLVASAFIYFPCSVSHGLLEAKQLVGTANLIRSIIFSLIYWGYTFVAINSYSKEYFSVVLFLGMLSLFIILSWLAKTKYEIKNLSDYGVGSFKQKKMFEVISYAKNSYLFNLVAGLMHIIEKSFLIVIYGSDYMARYSSQTELITKGNIFSGTVAAFIFPIISRKISDHEEKKPYKEWLYISDFVISVLIIVSLVIWKYSELIISLYLGGEFVEYSYISGYLAVGLLLNGMGQMGASLLKASGEYKIQSTSYLISFIVAIIVAYPLIYYYHFYGALVVYMIYRIADIYIYISALKKTSDFPRSIAKVLIIFIGYIAMLLLIK